jgi:hypothetical protein
MHEQTKRQVAASGVAGDGDLREAAADQTNVAGPNVIGRSWKRMFRCKPVVWDERSHASPSCDMARQMAKGAGRAPVEPPAVKMYDSLARSGICRAAPPSRNTTNVVSFVYDVSGSCDALHDGVERGSGRRSLELPLVWFDNDSHGKRRGLIFCAEWMEHGPSGRNVILKKRCHDVPPVCLVF